MRSTDEARLKDLTALSLQNKRKKEEALVEALRAGGRNVPWMHGPKSQLNVCNPYPIIFQFSSVATK